MIQSLIEKYKQHRKQQFLNRYSSYKGKYAFVGVGGHSTSNLYPVIDYLGIPLSYICTRNLTNATKMAIKFKDCKGTTSLDEVLNDPDINGVFVCASPSAHFAISKKVLAAGKHLFVEKPPCTSLTELNELIATEQSGQVTCIGLQKRYSQVYSTLYKQMKQAQSYQMHFVTGAFPEGNALWDLFIHPIDLINFLFGEVKELQYNHDNNKTTWNLLINHSEGVVGHLELSTAYTWNNAKEGIKVVCKNGVYESNHINDLRFYSKPGQIMGIPLEKVLRSNTTEEALISNTGFVPLAEYNQLFVQGYYAEIEAFVQACEGNKSTIKTALRDLIPTFNTVEKLPF